MESSNSKIPYQFIFPLIFTVPRTFRLYEELEKAEKAKLSDQSVSYGLTNGKSSLQFINFPCEGIGDDTTFTDWNGTIIGPPNTKFDNRIFFLVIKCGPSYPAKAPEVSFSSKINLPCVNQQNGRVEPSKFHIFANWKGDYDMEKVLIGLKNEMIANKNLS